MSIDKHPEKKNKIKIEKRTNETREQSWLKENKEAVDKHNEHIEKYGCFFDEYRRF